MKCFKCKKKIDDLDCGRHITKDHTIVEIELDNGMVTYFCKQCIKTILTKVVEESIPKERRSSGSSLGRQIASVENSKNWGPYN